MQHRAPQARPGIVTRGPDGSLLGCEESYHELDMLIWQANAFTYRTALPKLRRSSTSRHNQG